VTLSITAFRWDDDLLAAFLRVEERVYERDPVWSRLPRQDVRMQLSPKNPFFAEGEHRSFVAFEGADPVGRVVAMLAPRLIDEEGRPLGLVGFFECVDRPDVARPLLDTALAWLAERGVARTLGPMNFSTWYRYRFVTGGHERGPFLLEPYNAPWYGRLFEGAGFTPFNRYATLRVSLTPVPMLEAMHGRCARAGVTFEPLDLAQADETLPMFFDLSRRIFAGKTAYSAITLEEFQALYRGASAILEPGLSWIARDRQGAPLGFLFAYPDLLEPMRRGAPTARPETTVLKTIGIVPEAPKGLGWAMTHLHMEAARERGYRFSLFALMEKYHELMRYGGREVRRDEDAVCEVWKEYTLYAR
jgi:hypothetical protein